MHNGKKESQKREIRARDKEEEQRAAVDDVTHREKELGGLGCKIQISRHDGKSKECRIEHGGERAMGFCSRIATAGDV